MSTATKPTLTMSTATKPTLTRSTFHEVNLFLDQLLTGARSRNTFHAHALCPEQQALMFDTPVLGQILQEKDIWILPPL